MTRTWTVLLVATTVVGGLVFSSPNTPQALADGTPDISLSVSLDAETLHTDTTDVTLTASNTTGSDGFNLSYRVVLPPGASYAGGPIAPAFGDDPSILFFENVSDLLASNDAGFTFTIEHGVSVSVGSTLTVNADAHVNTNPRLVPDFDPVTGLVTGDSTGNASGSGATQVVAFHVRKTEPSPENELVRGLHTQQTTYTVTIENNPNAQTNDFRIEDWIPAGLEFLACGGDNSTVVVPPAVAPEEYPGSGPITTPAPPSCVLPTTVTTVNSGLPAGLPAGVYTHVVWDSTGALGDVDIAAGDSYTFNYAAAIPLRMNTMTWDGPGGVPATDGDQASNVDNNNGTSTQETGTELAFTNRAAATGTYSHDATAYTHDGSRTVSSEDVAMQKGVSPKSIIPGQISTWTVDIQVSEYTASATSIRVVDTVPDGLEPTGSSPAWTSATEHSDGTWTVVWDVAALSADAVTSITYTTVTLTHYQENGSNAAPVLAADSWENKISLTAFADGRAVADNSADGQAAGIPSILKEVAIPGGTVTSCGDGSAIADWDADDAGPYGPGDRVCWRLTVTGNQLYGDDYAVQDYLPDGFAYESWAYGENNTAVEANITFDGSEAASGYLRWELDDNATNTNPNAVFEAVVSTTITGPTGNGPGDLLSNLMKFGGENTPNEAYQLRDDADAVWGQPVVGIDKSADHTVVQGNDAVGFTIAVTNTGNVDALDVEVWDILPVGLECATVSAVSSSGVCNNGPDPDRIEWTIPTIAAGASVDLAYTVTVPLGVGANETFENRAGVREYDAPLNTGPNDRFPYIPNDNIDPSHPDTPNTEPVDDTWTLNTEALRVGKSRTTAIDEPGNAPGNEATIGERVDYTVTATIPEGVTVYDGVLVDDYLDARLAYVAGSASATLNSVPLPPGWTLDATSTAITIDYPAIYVNAPDSGDDTLILTFSATVLDVAANRRSLSVRNEAAQAWLDSAGGPNTAGSGRVWTRIVEPNLTIAKSNNAGPDGVVQAGQDVDYSLTVRNDNSVAYVSRAHDLVVVDTLPVQLDCTAVSSISNAGICSDTNPDTITWTGSTEVGLVLLDPGDSMTVGYTARFPDPIVTNAPFTNTARVAGTSMATIAGGERTALSANGGAGSGYQYEDQNTLTAPQTEIAKSVTPDVQTVGEPLQYTITVMYPRDTILYDATIIDTLPAGIGVASAYTASMLCEAGAVGSGTPCAPNLVPAQLDPNGSHIGWFLGDLTTTSAEDRYVTIVYDAYVDDVAAVGDEATLTNSVNSFANQVNRLGLITQVPDVPNYDVIGTPATTDVTVREPNLVLSKRVLDGGTAVGERRALSNENLTYEITLTHTGAASPASNDWPAYDVAVTDSITIPSGNDVTAVSIVDGNSNGIAYAVVDGNPTDGTLEWFIDGPIQPGESVTISYTVRVWDADENDENASGPEITNTAANPSYWAVSMHAPGDGHREYTGNNDTAEVELDLASIGDTVWFDIDGGGGSAPSTEDLPIPNATVTVTYLGPDGAPGGGDDEVHITTTDANGRYLVEDLPGGAHTVAVTGFPAGLTPTYDLDGTLDGVWNGTLPEDAAQRDVDFAYTGSGSIGDLVWLDRNGDGMQDSDEPGIGSTEVTVTFAGFDGTPGTADDVVYVATTDSVGRYVVANLPEGGYTVEVTDMPLAGVDVTFDSDDGIAGPDGIWSGSLAASEAKRDVDFGYNGDGSIGDTVWLDRDRDGVRDGDEPGIAGVDVWLTWPGPDGALGTPDDVVFTDTTDANGVYGFVGLNPGDYSVQIDSSTLPAGMDATFDEDLVGDPSATPDGLTGVSLADGAMHDTADFGYGGSDSIGDFVWWDLDGDGVQDVGEPGIPGVDVEVVWAGVDGVLGTADDVTYVTATDASGGYLVEDLPDGDYRVTVLGALPLSATNTHDFDGDDNSTADAALAGGVPNLALDFGYVGDNAIGDFVWYDVDGDGVQDAGEPPVPSVELTLTWAGVDGLLGTADDMKLPPVLTDAAGAYGFAALPDGEYRVEVTGGLPMGLAPTWDEDSGTTSPDGTTIVTGLAGGTNHATADFGYNGDGSIGDTVFWDLDGDGNQGLDEPGFPNVDVTVTWAGVDGVLGTADDYAVVATTDDAGGYLVEDLPGGLFEVAVDRTGLPSDVIQTGDPDAALDDSSRVVLPASGVDPDQDFGYRGSSSIGDTVWFDVDVDGVQDVGEPGVADVTVVVTWFGADGAVGGGDDVVITTTTDAGGIYQVPGLVAGSYDVEIVESTLPAGAVPDSDVDGGVPTTSMVTLATGEDRADVDFGVVGSASLSGTVWHDVSADGVINVGEAGVPGVVVHVTWHGPNGPITFDVTTDASGGWSLENLPSGEYTAEIDMATVPSGYVATTPESVNVTLPPVGSGTVDYGVVGSATIGSTVWVDTNGNGTVDAGERGIEGVLVDLIDSTGTVVRTTATSSTGAYEFDELVPGSYTVRLEQGSIPPDLDQTYAKSGPLDLTTTETVAEGQSMLDVNFGFQERALPVTGEDLARLVLMAFMLIAGGVVLRLIPKRRRDEDG